MVTNKTLTDISLVEIHCTNLNFGANKDLVLPNEVPAQPTNHTSSPQDAAPVHRLCRHRYGDGEKGEHPSNNEPGQADDVDSKTISPHVPGPKNQFALRSPFPDQESNGNGVGAKIACDCQRYNGVEGHGRADVDQTQE